MRHCGNLLSCSGAGRPLITSPRPHDTQARRSLRATAAPRRLGRGNAAACARSGRRRAAGSRSPQRRPPARKAHRLVDRAAEGHHVRVTALAFQHAGPSLASADADGMLMLWQPASTGDRSPAPSCRPALRNWHGRRTTNGSRREPRTGESPRGRCREAANSDPGFWYEYPGITSGLDRLRGVTRLAGAIAFLPQDGSRTPGCAPASAAACTATGSPD